MTLLERVVGMLQRQAIPHALIGAGALAVHGVSRSTLDQDLLTTDTRALDGALWADFPGTEADIRRGDADDPLVGVIRFRAAGERDVDLVVGRDAWQRDVISRAEPLRIAETDVPVVTAPDLVLLKLYAGGTQDRWDIEQLLAVEPSDTLRAQVESRLPALPPRCRELWSTTFR